MTFTGINVPIELVVPVILGLVAAIGWLALRYDRAIERTGNLRASKREAAILLREALREREPDLEPLSFDDDSALLEVEYKKDKARVTRVRNISSSPPEESRSDELSLGQERRLERFGRTGDPSTPPNQAALPPDRRDRPDRPDRPRKKLPSRSGRE